MTVDGRENRALQEGDHWERVFHAVSDGVLVTDTEGKILAVNAAMLELLAVSEDHLTGCYLGENEGATFGATLTPLGRPEASEEHCLRLVQEFGKIQGYEWLINNTRGEQHWVRVSGTALGSPDSESERFVFTMQDITELRVVERAKERFVQLMGHELRNPLQVIRGLATLLRIHARTGNAVTVANCVDRLDQQVQQLSELVNEMLTAYVSRGDRLQIRPRVFCLEEFLQHIVTTFSTSAIDYKIMLCAAGSGHARVRADSQRLMQVMTNLLGNAIKYSPPGTRIWVRIETDGGWAFVHVEDEGVGIPPDRLEQVFDGFYRVEDLCEWAPEGLGLGLFISRNIARRHGGDLWAENRSEGGTRITLKLPVAGRMDDCKEQETGKGAPPLVKASRG